MNPLCLQSPRGRLSVREDNRGGVRAGGSPGASFCPDPGSPPRARSARRKMRGLLQTCETRKLRFAESLPTRSGGACLDGPRCPAQAKRSPLAKTATSARRCSAHWISKGPAAPSARAGRKGWFRRASRCCCCARPVGQTGKSAPANQADGDEHSRMVHRAPLSVVRSSIRLMNGTGSLS